MNPTEIFHFTVGDLKKILEEFPDGMPVLVNGFEGGYENFSHPYVIKVEHYPENHYTEGEFEYSKNGIEALLFERNSRDD